MLCVFFNIIASKLQFLLMLVRYFVISQSSGCHGDLYLSPYPVL